MSSVSCFIKAFVLRWMSALWKPNHRVSFISIRCCRLLPYFTYLASKIHSFKISLPCEPNHYKKGIPRKISGSAQKLEPTEVCFERVCCIECIFWMLPRNLALGIECGWSSMNSGRGRVSPVTRWNSSKNFPQNQPEIYKMPTKWTWNLQNADEINLKSTNYRRKENHNVYSWHVSQTSSAETCSLNV